MFVSYPLRAASPATRHHFSHTDSATDAIKRRLPAYEAHYGAAFASHLSTSLSAAAARSLTLPGVDGGDESMLRTRNIFLSVGVCALSTENMRAFKPVVVDLIRACASVFDGGDVHESLQV